MHVSPDLKAREKCDGKDSEDECADASHERALRRMPMKGEPTNNIIKDEGATAIAQSLPLGRQRKELGSNENALKARLRSLGSSGARCPHKPSTQEDNEIDQEQTG